MTLNLKKLRQKKGITQKEIAERFKWTSPQFVSNVERGLAMPANNILKPFGEMYGLSLDQIIKWKLGILERRMRKEAK